jgi:hypothetical protein
MAMLLAVVPIAMVLAAGLVAFAKRNGSSHVSYRDDVRVHAVHASQPARRATKSDAHDVRVNVVRVASSRTKAHSVRARGPRETNNIAKVGSPPTGRSSGQSASATARHPRQPQASEARATPTANASNTLPTALATANASGTPPIALATEIASNTLPTALATANASGTLPTALATANASGTPPIASDVPQEKLDNFKIALTRCLDSMFDAYIQLHKPVDVTKVQWALFIVDGSMWKRVSTLYVQGKYVENPDESMLIETQRFVLKVYMKVLEDKEWLNRVVLGPDRNQIQIYQYMTVSFREFITGVRMFRPGEIGMLLGDDNRLDALIDEFLRTITL